MMIWVLCKVLDNYGDIGVAHRLCRELSFLLGKGGSPIHDGKIVLAVDSLKSYRLLCPEVDETKSLQKIMGITVLDCNDSKTCLKQYNETPPDVILQCFQCGYPKWLEDALFGRSGSIIHLPPPNAPNNEAAAKAGAASNGRSPFASGDKQNCLQGECRLHDVSVIDIDYLTAEEWAGEFHKMPSLTRSARVHKSLFMPGFTRLTGGLLLHGRAGGIPCLPSKSRAGGAAGAGGITLMSSACQKIFVFGYERGYAPLVHALSGMAQGGRKITVLAANGAGQPSFLDAWHQAGEPFPVTALPFIPQEQWDKMLLSADIAFVRGEDSLAGAALAGVPFVWEAYRQAEGAHIKKVKALLHLMQPYFSSPQMEIVSRLWILWNGTGGRGASYTRGASHACRLQDAENKEMQELLFKFMQEPLAPSFSAFAQSLIKNGDLAENLLEYIALAAGRQRVADVVSPRFRRFFLTGVEAVHTHNTLI